MVADPRILQLAASEAAHQPTADELADLFRPADEPCPDCLGTGAAGDCWTCDGTGRVAPIPTPAQIVDRAINQLRLPPRSTGRHGRPRKALCGACGATVPAGVRDCPRCGEDARVESSDDARRYAEHRRRQEGGVI